jgi:predicted PurR-regulated permease PerM
MDQITAKLADTFENQASAKADTFQGKLTRLQIAFDEGKETVGAYILTAITPMVEIIVNKVIPAIQDFTSNLGEKLQPVMKIIKPIIDGVRSAFNSVSGSLKENNQELQPFINFMKVIYNFAKDYLAPIIGETLGFAFKALGKIISTIIDQFSNMVSLITSIYNKIKSMIDFIKGAGSAVGNFFSGASSSGGASFSNASFATSTGTSAPTLSPEIMDSDSRLRAFAQGRTTSITVNGAIDPESTARQIVGLLNDSSARGTLGSSGLVFA